MNKSVNKLGIIIPVYKSTLSPNEIISFNSIIINLQFYEIIIITYEKIDLSILFSEFEGLQDKVKVEFFHEYFFSDLNSYNKLLRSYKFYIRFSNFEFILICQLDTYVFSENIDYWISKNYSYIGAPWINESGNGFELVGVGNGGLSLRKVNDYLRVFKLRYVLIRIWIVFKYNYKYKRVRQNSWLLLIEGLKKMEFFKLSDLFLFIDKNEDLFWSQVIPKKFNWFEVANVEEALKFSFEKYPKICFALNNNKLPFGCHAWEKYDISFWLPYIKPNH